MTLKSLEKKSCILHFGGYFLVLRLTFFYGQRLNFSKFHPLRLSHWPFLWRKVINTTEILILSKLCQESMKIVRLWEYKWRHYTPCGTLVVSASLLTFLLVVSVHILLGRLGQYEKHKPTEQKGKSRHKFDLETAYGGKQCVIFLAVRQNKRKFKNFSRK